MMSRNCRGTQMTNRNGHRVELRLVEKVYVGAADGFLALWLILVVVLAAASSFLPARSASRQTVRDVLAYE
jgi:hypothetical protein